jgi:hypothetical protein
VIPKKYMSQKVEESPFPNHNSRTQTIHIETPEGNRSEGKAHWQSTDQMLLR